MTNRASVDQSSRPDSTNLTATARHSWEPRRPLAAMPTREGSSPVGAAGCPRVGNCPRPPPTGLDPLIAESGSDSPAPPSWIS